MILEEKIEYFLSEVYSTIKTNFKRQDLNLSKI
jgi:hypothetical protein